MSKRSQPVQKKKLRMLAGMLLLLSNVLVHALPAYSQEVTGGIEGEVKDPTGAVVPGAKVTATSPQRSYSTTTDGKGQYQFPSLAPGVYSISAMASGFSVVKIVDVTVEL